MKTLALILALIATPALCQPVWSGPIVPIGRAGQVRPGFVVCGPTGVCVKPRATWNLHTTVVASQGGYAVFMVGDDLYGVPARAVLIDCPTGELPLRDFTPLNCPR